MHISWFVIIFIHSQPMCLRLIGKGEFLISTVGDLKQVCCRKIKIKGRVVSGLDAEGSEIKSLGEKYDVSHKNKDPQGD